MTNLNAMLELEEKVNNAAKECSNRLWNKKWNPGQDMLATAFIEGVKWLARESMKEQEKLEPSAEVCIWPEKAPFDECGDKPDFFGRIANPFKEVN